MIDLVRRALPVGLVVWSLVLVGEFAPEALAGISVFRVRTHEFHGLRFLDPGAVLRTAGIGPDASLWDDPGPWEERLARHPLVVRAEIRRRFPSTLVVSVEEREPVGLVPAPTLVAVDAGGQRLPLDPTRFPLDYPVLRPDGRRGEGSGEVSDPVGRLARAAAVMRTDAEFWSEVSEVEYAPGGGMIIHRGDPEVLFLLSEDVEPRRLREGMAVLEDALQRSAGRRPKRVDLRFQEHVFLDWGRGGPP
ncbi:MAG: FtsQ-type POTRA domain-containing protein [Longimicrobiales bacterium]|nr:FtsQ-type POTRA domain-containing protein [Longimicrobiales bacterium]